jgi:hypothetical protein
VSEMPSTATVAPYRLRNSVTSMIVVIGPSSSSGATRRRLPDQPGGTRCRKHRPAW